MIYISPGEIFEYLPESYLKNFEFHENPSKKNYWIKAVSWCGDFFLLIKRVFWKPQFINPRRVN